MYNVDLLIRLLVAVLALLPAFSASAAEPSGRTDRSQMPITVTADHLQADNKGKKAIFSGRVVSRQQDVTIYADRLEIYYGEQSEEVDRIIAVGNVRIVQSDRIGTGGHAVYETRAGRITLTVNPRVTRGNDSITGNVITYHIDDERSVVDGGGSGRVEAVIHPKAGSAPRKSDDGSKR
ncbi:lipopolysaccharide transport periplasmic protein LptA [Trichlorobacter ammonificans]|uniref:Lipopolysaccharide export system protein LptA n=1 Tax=Trichlorobacter ammonificans TaxID=2916410 RepID=A0ABM9D6S9_9BACT|nr:lipopolysaccharide transport periplasmic protein LptA [Trichlorobacter ammonificans]CAH2030703.1 Lipopolysaccharide export system protein LptA [Trichlorobacter ammonificans]